MALFDKMNKATYVIAEIGINHDGDLAKCKKLMDRAGALGVHAAKIQVRCLEEVYAEKVLKDPLLAEHGTQYLMDELAKAHLSFEQVEELFSYAKAFRYDFFATPFDLKSAHFLNDLGQELFKIGSPDFTNLLLIDEVVGFNKPIILSTGMSDEGEISEVVDFLQTRKADFSLLHCNSTYPASVSDINLNFIPKLKHISGVKVGYSGHEQGYVPSLGAVALGAQIIERHLTLDVDSSGPDHSSSLDFETFSDFMTDLNKLELSLGKAQRLQSQGERNNFLALAKSLVATQSIKSGETAKKEHFTARSPAKGMSVLNLPKVQGKKFISDVAAGEYIQSKHFEQENKSFEFDIPRKWGIVGRLNDYRDYLHFKPKLVEIHLTWRDLVAYENPQVEHEQDLVVHAPEYYRDELIDFTTSDPDVVEYSLEMLRKTIDLARDLDKQFKGQADSRGPRIVVHPGGHFANPKTPDRRTQYENLIRNLRSVNTDGVRVLVENMPPFPWYHGGQWYNTVFMDASEIVEFSDEIGWGICYDVSHAQLFCNSAKIDLGNFTRTILSKVEYLHLADASGVTNEGMQIGAGNVDFEQLFEILGQMDKGFIPEIWQGHLNQGAGFSTALSSIETLLKKMSGHSCSHH